MESLLMFGAIGLGAWWLYDTYFATAAVAATPAPAATPSQTANAPATPSVPFQCPAGFTLTGNACVANPPAAPLVCGPGYTLANGTCNPNSTLGTATAAAIAQQIQTAQALQAAQTLATQIQAQIQAQMAAANPGSLSVNQGMGRFVINSMGAYGLR